MRRKFSTGFVACGLGVCLSAAAGSVSLGQSTEEFFRGKTIRVVVGSAAGGGYDVYARATTRVMSRHLPGNPGFVIQNMPGGGGLLAANYLFNIAGQQGLEIGMVERGSPFEHLFHPDEHQARFEPRKFNWIGSPEQEIGLGFLRLPSPVKTIEDVRTHELVVSATTHTALTSVYPRLLNNLFGMKFKVVEGYPSSQEALYALNRGEVEAHVSGASSGIMRGQVGPWIADGKVKVILQMGLRPDPAFPGAALVTDLARNDADRQILDLLFAQQVISYPFLAPPGVPAERVRAFRDAFDEAMKDPDFLADARRANLAVNPVSGADIDALLERVEKTPTDILARASALLANDK